MKIPSPEQLNAMTDEELEELLRSAPKSAPSPLREAADNRLVVVPNDFDGKIKPDEIVQVIYRHLDDNTAVSFLVHESIVINPKLYDAFATRFENEFPELFPHADVSFRDLDLNDDVESFANIGVYTIEEVEARFEKMKPREYLLDGYIPAQSLTMSVGDSNIGKTPAQYQLGICIAAGVPFFGIPTTRGRVLYLDFENTIDDAKAKPRDIARYLGLHAVPKYFKLWHPAMAVEGYDENHIWKIVKETSPTLVIIDTLSASFPNAEADNPKAGEFIKTCRTICRAVGCAIMFTHHLVKSSGRNNVPAQNGFAPPAEPTIQEHMKDVRGASALINGVDVRWMFKKPRTDGGPCAFELHGFRRMHGTLPMISVERVFDDKTGDAIGYNRLAGVELIQNERYREIFGKLPRAFQWKDLKAQGLGGGSTRHCVDAYLSAKVIDPPEDGQPFRKREGM